MKKTSIALIFSYLVLTLGCASAPQQMIIAPQVYNAASNLYQGQRASLSVTDMRPGTQVLQVFKNEQAAQLFSPQKDIANVVDGVLNKAWTKQGLALAGIASNQIEVYIDKAVVNVNQELMKYTSNSQVTIRVIVANGKETLTKTFNSNGSSNGPLKADIAVLERDFNQLLAQTLSQIISDSEIQRYIK